MLKLSEKYFALYLYANVYSPMVEEVHTV